LSALPFNPRRGCLISQELIYGRRDKSIVAIGVGAASPQLLLLLLLMRVMMTMPLAFVLTIPAS